MQIFKPFGFEESGIFFDKIVSIKTYGHQHAYDLMIDGVRNFIADAHNDYAYNNASFKNDLENLNPSIRSIRKVALAC